MFEELLQSSDKLKQSSDKLKQTIERNHNELKQSTEQNFKALKKTMNKNQAMTTKALGSMAEKLERTARVMRKADKQLRSPMLITTGTELLSVASRQLGLRPNRAGLVKAVLEGHRGLRAKEQLLLKQLEVEGKRLKVELQPFHDGDDWPRRADALQQATQALRATGGKSKKWSWDTAQGQLTAYYQAAAQGEDALRSFLEDPRQDALLLTLVVAMAARRNADVVEFNAAPLIRFVDGEAVVRLLEIKAHAAELKTAKKRLLEQAAILAVVLRRAVLDGLDMQLQFRGQASSALDHPSGAQLCSLHGRKFPLAFEGGPWELEHLHLRLSLLDE